MVYKVGPLRLVTPILIVGNGVSGKAIHRLLRAAGLPEDLLAVYDDHDPTADFNKSGPAESFCPKTLVVSPGVSLKTPWIQNLVQSGARLTSELELALHFLRFEKVIGITGSVGKSTVSAAIAWGLESEAFLGGNFGTPLAEYAFQTEFQGAPRKLWVVLELSSYQLENFPSLQADFAILTSLTPNHMERYESLQDYYLTKLSLIKKTKGSVVANSSGFDLKATLQAHCSSKTLAHQIVFTDHSDPLIKNFFNNKPKLLGTHNLDNLALALRLGQLAGFPTEYFSKVIHFPGLSHRLENLGNKNGVVFVNDSKATTIASVLQAVASLASEIASAKKFFLLLGGKDKNLPWGDFKKMVRPENCEPLYFGESALKAEAGFGQPGKKFPTLKSALLDLKTHVGTGDLVLLSPGGTSLDEFKSFEERGEFFKNEISKW